MLSDICDSMKPDWRFCTEEVMLLWSLTDLGVSLDLSEVEETVNLRLSISRLRLSNFSKFSSSMALTHRWRSRMRFSKLAKRRLDSSSLVVSKYTLCQIAGSDRGAKGALAPPIFRSIKTSEFSTNAQSRNALVVLDSVLGPPWLACHT